MHLAKDQDKIDETRPIELTEQEKTNLRRRRYATEKTDRIPDKIAFKFATSPLGCYRLVFN